MTEYRVPPGCTGLTMDSGHRYDATRTGRVTVDNPAHARQIEKASSASGGPISRAVHTGPPGGPSRHCPACRFTGYPWQAECPRCHIPMPLREAVSAAR